ncbi:MAG: hypothetical protein BWY30_01026 [Tenericutes bacterium ADurb.Bin239]|nr:MAG: hypothetical protein BWY30_01026 [Tenericutes bacterium ADurb.Bin239]
MNVLKIRALNPHCHNVIFLFDGKPLKPKGNNMGHFVFEYKTEKETVELVVIRRSGLQSKFWLWWQLLFFIVSLFGIFDIHNKKLKSEGIYRAIIHLDGNDEFDLKFDTGYPKLSFLEITTTLRVDEIHNEIINDPVIKRRGKRVKIVKVITLLIFVALAIVVSVII